MSPPLRQTPPLGLMLVLSAVLFVLAAILTVVRGVGEFSVLAGNIAEPDAVRRETTLP